ncbi:MAG: SLC13 family permease [Kiritimatiellae bacterium]|jgi:Na+/H+ antiporter NhaD/arsenite permease-like protein|nr:SLC13 family permease [Kiritimatiellia bacterium]
MDYLPLIIFVVAYTGFIWRQHSKSWTALVAALVLVVFYAFGVLSSPEAGGSQLKFIFGQVLHWNVLGLMTSMMLLSFILEESHLPEVLAERLVERSGNARMALFWVVMLTGFFSIFLCNVSCVLLVAPVALSLTRKLKMSPVRPLICLAIASNLQGVATLIGDPPSMLMAGHMKLTFNDFFFYQGKPGIFWVVEIGAIASMVVVYLALRPFSKKIDIHDRVKPRSWVPSILIGVLVLILACASSIDKSFTWFAGTVGMLTAAFAALWYVKVVAWGGWKKLFKSVDWETLLFLIGMFIMVQSLSDAGWLQKIADSISTVAAGNMFLAFVLIVGVSVFVSGLVDNVPFLVAMIPVADSVARSFSAEGGFEKVPLMMFGLLAGACLGGNITPIGAAANVVAIGILKKEGYPVTFWQFMRIGLPFTIVAVLAGCSLIWFVWS